MLLESEFLQSVSKFVQDWTRTVHKLTVTICTAFSLQNQQVTNK